MRVRDVLAVVAMVIYCGSWFLVAIYSAWWRYRRASRDSTPDVDGLAKRPHLHAHRADQG